MNARIVGLSCLMSLVAPIAPAYPQAYPGILAPYETRPQCVDLVSGLVAWLNDVTAYSARADANQVRILSADDRFSPAREAIDEALIKFAVGLSKDQADGIRDEMVSRLKAGTDPARLSMAISKRARILPSLAMELSAFIIEAIPNLGIMYESRGLTEFSNSELIELMIRHRDLLKAYQGFKSRSIDLQCPINNQFYNRVASALDLLGASPPPTDGSYYPPGVVRSRPVEAYSPVTIRKPPKKNKKDKDTSHAASPNSNRPSNEARPLPSSAQAAIEEGKTLERARRKAEQQAQYDKEMTEYVKCKERNKINRPGQPDVRAFCIQPSPPN